MEFAYRVEKDWFGIIVPRDGSIDVKNSGNLEDLCSAFNFEISEISESTMVINKMDEMDVFQTLLYYINY